MHQIGMWNWSLPAWAGRRFSEWQAEVDAERAARQGRRHLRLVVDNTRPATEPGAADRAPAQVDRPRAA